MNQKALRAGSHCVGDGLCREATLGVGPPPQAVNPVEQDSLITEMLAKRAFIIPKKKGRGLWRKQF